MLDSTVHPLVLSVLLGFRGGRVGSVNNSHSFRASQTTRRFRRGEAPWNRRVRGEASTLDVHAGSSRTTLVSSYRVLHMSTLQSQIKKCVEMVCEGYTVCVFFSFFSSSFRVLCFLQPGHLSHRCCRCRRLEARALLEQLAPTMAGDHENASSDEDWTEVGLRKLEEGDQGAKERAMGFQPASSVRDPTFGVSSSGLRSPAFPDFSTRLGFKLLLRQGVDVEVGGRRRRRMVHPVGGWNWTPLGPRRRSAKSPTTGTPLGGTTPGRDRCRRTAVTCHSPHGHCKSLGQFKMLEMIDLVLRKIRKTRAVR